MVSMNDVEYVSHCTRLYISFTPLRLVRQIAGPRRRYVEVLTHVLKYLQDMLNHGTNYTGTENGDIISCTGDDYAGSRDPK